MTSTTSPSNQAPVNPTADSPATGNPIASNPVPINPAPINPASDEQTLLPPGRHHNTRVWVLALVCLAELAGLTIGYWPAFLPFATAHPIATADSIVSFIVCMAYATGLSSETLSCRHTVIPLLTIMLLVTGTLDQLFMPLLIVTFLCSAHNAKSFFIGAIRTSTALAPIPVIRAILGGEPATLRRIIEGSTPSAAVLDYLVGHWIAPLLIIAVAIVAVRLVCDLLVFVLVGVPISAAMPEFSLTRIIGLAVCDLAAAVLMVWTPAIVEFSDSLTDILNVHVLFLALLDAYALGLLSFYAVRRLMRYRNSLRAITAVTDSLPLPHTAPENVVASTLNREMPNVRCFISSRDALARRPWHSYRASGPIGSGKDQYVLVFERSMFNRPFLPADAAVLASSAEILAEELRVHQEVTTLRTEGERDPLTGAYTYGAFVSYLKTLETGNSANTIAIVYLEIERFRHINERFGRRTGNVVLRATADRIRRMAPDDAMLVRVDGDSFAVVLHEVTPGTNVDRLAEDLRNTTSLPVHADDAIVSLSTMTSTAIVAPRDFAQIDAVLANAGIGGDAVALAGAVEESDSAQSVLASGALGDAIEKNSFTMRYQPAFDLRTNTMVGVNAIPHIVGADGQPLQHDFIANEAVRLQLGTRLTIDTIEQALRDMAQLRAVVSDADAPRVHTLGFLLNGGELDDAAFYEYMETASAKHPEVAFHLQIGRDAIQHAGEGPDCEDDIKALAALPNMRLVIVEGGTSFSEIAALAQIPADALTLDASVVQDLENPRAHTIVSEILDAAKRNHFAVYLSGVSTPDQVQELLDLGCAEVIGDLFATPMTASELRMRLETTGLSANMEYVAAGRDAKSGADGGDGGDGADGGDGGAAKGSGTAADSSHAAHANRYEVPPIQPIDRPSFDN